MHSIYLVYFSKFILQEREKECSLGNVKNKFFLLPEPYPYNLQRRSNFLHNHWSPRTAHSPVR